MLWFVQLFQHCKLYQYSWLTAFEIKRIVSQDFLASICWDQTFAFGPITYMSSVHFDLFDDLAKILSISVYSPLWNKNTLQKTLKCFGMQRWKIFPIVGYNMKDYSGVWYTPQNNFIIVNPLFIPCCGLHRRIIFHGVGYRME